MTEMSVDASMAVSYTHLDVYKRQELRSPAVRRSLLRTGRASRGHRISGRANARLFMRPAQRGDLFGVACEIRVGGLQVERQVAQLRMVRHGGQGFEADLAFADAGVAVLVRTAGIHACLLYTSGHAWNGL